MEAAQARIDALIARAGGPMMICKNTKEADTEKKEQIMLYVRTISRRDFGGSVAMYFNHLIDTIDRLEAALFNTLNERDQLKRDLHDACSYDWVLRTCHFCAHLEEPSNKTPCETCLHHKGKPGFEWRGVPDKEE